MSDEVLAVVRASTMRRGLGVATLALLGFVVVYTAVMRPPAEPAWQMFLILVGVFALWAAEKMRRATLLAVELTQDSLRSSDGEVIATLEQINSVDRSMFAFKPSNGFILRLNVRAPGRWLPGLWWRMGKRVGIGGVTAGSQAKTMADILAAMLMDRKGGSA